MALVRTEVPPLGEWGDGFVWMKPPCPTARHQKLYASQFYSDAEGSYTIFKRPGAEVIDETRTAQDWIEHLARDLPGETYMCVPHLSYGHMFWEIFPLHTLRKSHRWLVRLRGDFADFIDAHLERHERLEPLQAFLGGAEKAEAIQTPAYHFNGLDGDRAILHRVAGFLAV